MSCVSWSKTQGVAAGASKVWPTESGNRLVRLEITQSLNLSSCAREGNRKSAQRSLLCKTFITIMGDKALFNQGKYHFGFINIDITKPYKTILAIIQKSQFGVR